MKTRGIRNHNPGNIDYHSGTKWAGQLPHDAKIEARFCRFESPIFGIRALAKLLLNYQRKYGINTVAGVIMRWAPATENNTRAYIDSVADDCGVDSVQEIVIADHLPAMVRAIIAHENGQQPYSDETINAGIALAMGGK